LPSLTFINHATVLLQLDGVNILTDPIYSFSLGFYIPRLRKPGVPFDALPDIDAILISHADYDHLNLRTLRRLRRKHQSTIVFPAGLGNYGNRAGFENVRELSLWETFDEKHARITCVPAKHNNKRLPWKSASKSTCGYVIEKAGTAVYFAGDTGYDIHFGQIAERLSVDVALLPIGAYKPHHWFKNVHLNPSTSLRAFRDLNAKFFIPIHWGTFKISDEPMNEPPKLLQEKAEEEKLSERVKILQNGETFSW